MLWKGITEMLDKRTAAIAKALSDAEQLRADATKAKTEAERTLAQAATDAKDIIQQAREEAARMQARAAANLETSIALREQQARDRIAQSEVGRHQAGARHRRRRGAVGHARAAARAGCRSQRAGAGRPGDRRAAAPPALIFRNSDRPHKTNRGLPMAPVARRGFFLARSHATGKSGGAVLRRNPSDVLDQTGRQVGRL